MGTTNELLSYVEGGDEAALVETIVESLSDELGPNNCRGELAFKRDTRTLRPLPRSLPANG